VHDKDTLDEMRVSNANLSRRVLALEVELDTNRKKAKKEVEVLQARVEDGERRLIEVSKRALETNEADVKLETASFVFKDDEEEEAIHASSSSVSLRLTDKLVLSPGGTVVIL
jgi:hypothetical protein